MSDPELDRVVDGLVDVTALVPDVALIDSTATALGLLPFSFAKAKGVLLERQSRPLSCVFPPTHRQRYLAGGKSLRWHSVRTRGL